MVGRRSPLLVQLLQVLDEIMYSLGVEKLLPRQQSCQRDHFLQSTTLRMTCDGSVVSIARMY